MLCLCLAVRLALAWAGPAVPTGCTLALAYRHWLHSSTGLQTLAAPKHWLINTGCAQALAYKHWLQTSAAPKHWLINTGCAQALAYKHWLQTSAAPKQRSRPLKKSFLLPGGGLITLSLSLAKGARSSACTACSSHCMVWLSSLTASTTGWSAWDCFNSKFCLSPPMSYRQCRPAATTSSTTAWSASDCLSSNSVCLPISLASTPCPSMPPSGHVAACLALASCLTF